MHHLPDESVHLIVTSPPYNADIDYDIHEDLLSFADYRDMIRHVWKECFRVLVDGGRLCVNVADVFRKPTIPLQSYVNVDCIEIGYLLRSQIIWDKGYSGGKAVLTGSWQSASNPNVIDQHEYISVFSKNRYDRENKAKGLQPYEFKEYTRSIWQFQTESATRIGHPAPFPLELPRRLINLYSFKDDVVLDPFMGSGTTLVAAKELGRQYVGYDISPAYCNLAEQRLRQEYLF